MHDRQTESTAEEWLRRKERSEEFFEACFVDEGSAMLVDEAQRSGQIDMTQARELWREIAQRRTHH